ncbi:hypothetical protein V5T82_08230 [Magnetovibrio sp. PR-2]|uniref:hypothetical protein n=1 Tax=Magnetovibrio sp. PR-2 TaxID=3120356 RepID=UPI002FCE2F2D
MNVSGLKNADADRALIFLTLISLLLLHIPSAVADELLTDPIAPQGLEYKHDYSSVDISSLTEWEKTFVPEARKEPILKHILTTLDWELKPGADQAPYCSDVFKKIQNWVDVEIIEPNIRANSYGDTAFSEWHKNCPDFFPHKSKIVTPGAASPTYGTHHFKVYELPHGILNDGEVVFYHQGGHPHYYIDGYGNKGDKEMYPPSGDGRFRIVNASSCKKVLAFRFLPSDAFSYPPANPQLPYAESAVMKADDRYVIVAARVSGLPLRHFLSINQLGPNGLYAKQPNCLFSSKR